MFPFPTSTGFGALRCSVRWQAPAANADDPHQIPERRRQAATPWIFLINPLIEKQTDKHGGCIGISCHTFTQDALLQQFHACPKSGPGLHGLRLAC